MQQDTNRKLLRYPLALSLRSSRPGRSSAPPNLLLRRCENMFHTFDETGHESKAADVPSGRIIAFLCATRTPRSDATRYSPHVRCNTMRHQKHVALSPLPAASLRVPQVPDEYTGAVVDLLSRRKGEMLNMTPVETGGDAQMTNIEYLVPTRGMIGLRNSMLTATRGTAVMDTIFDSYRPYAGTYVRVAAVTVGGPSVWTAFARVLLCVVYIFCYIGRCFAIEGSVSQSYPYPYPLAQTRIPYDPRGGYCCPRLAGRTFPALSMRPLCLLSKASVNISVRPSWTI